MFGKLTFRLGVDFFVRKSAQIETALSRLSSTTAHTTAELSPRTYLRRTRASSRGGGGFEAIARGWHFWQTLDRSCEQGLLALSANACLSYAMLFWMTENESTGALWRGGGRLVLEEDEDEDSFFQE